MVKRTDYFLQIPFCDMSIYFRSFTRCVSEYFLNITYIRTVLKQMCSKAMPQRMNGSCFYYSSPDTPL